MGVHAEVRLVNDLDGLVALRDLDRLTYPTLAEVRDPQGNNVVFAKQLVAAAERWTPGFAATIAVEVVHHETEKVPVTNTVDYMLTVLNHPPVLTLTAYADEAGQNLEHFPPPHGALADSLCPADFPCRMSLSAPDDAFHLHPRVLEEDGRESESALFWPRDPRLRLRLTKELKAGETHRLLVETYNAPAREDDPKTNALRNLSFAPFSGRLLQSVLVTVALRRSLARFNGQNIWSVFDPNLGRDPNADYDENRRIARDINRALLAMAGADGVAKTGEDNIVNPGQTGPASFELAYHGVRRGLHVLYANRADLGGRNYDGYQARLCARGASDGNAWRRATAREAAGLMTDGERVTLRLRDEWSDALLSPPGLPPGAALTFELAPRLPQETAPPLSGPPGEAQSYSVIEHMGVAGVGVVMENGEPRIADNRNLAPGMLCVAEAEPEYYSRRNIRPVSGVAVEYSGPPSAFFGRERVQTPRNFQVSRQIYHQRHDFESRPTTGVLYRGSAHAWSLQERTLARGLRHNHTVSIRMENPHPALTLRARHGVGETGGVEYPTNTEFDVSVLPGYVLRGKVELTLTFTPESSAAMTLIVGLPAAPLAWWKRTENADGDVLNPIREVGDIVTIVNAPRDAYGTLSSGGGGDFELRYHGIRRGLHVLRFAARQGDARPVCAGGSNERTQWRAPTIGEYLGVFSNSDFANLALDEIVDERIGGISTRETVPVFTPPAHPQDAPLWDPDPARGRAIGYGNIYGENDDGAFAARVVYHEPGSLGPDEGVGLHIQSRREAAEDAVWGFCVSEVGDDYPRQPNLSGLRAEFLGTIATRMRTENPVYASAESYVGARETALTITMSAIRHDYNPEAPEGAQIQIAAQPLEMISASLLPRGSAFTARIRAAPDSPGIATILISAAAPVRKAGAQTLTLRARPALGAAMEMIVTVEVGPPRPTLDVLFRTPAEVFAAPHYRGILFSPSNSGVRPELQRHEILDAAGLDLSLSQYGGAFAVSPLPPATVAAVVMHSFAGSAGYGARAQVNTVFVNVLDEIPPVQAPPVDGFAPRPVPVSLDFTLPYFHYLIRDASPPGSEFRISGSVDGGATLIPTDEERQLPEGAYSAVAGILAHAVRGTLLMTVNVSVYRSRAVFGGHRLNFPMDRATVTVRGRETEALYLGRRRDMDFVASAQNHKDGGLLADFCRVGRVRGADKWRPLALQEFMGLFSDERTETIGGAPQTDENFSAPGIGAGYGVTLWPRREDDPVNRIASAGFADVFLSSGAKVFPGLFSTDDFSLLNYRPVADAREGDAAENGGLLICGSDLIGHRQPRHYYGVVFREVDEQSGRDVERNLSVLEAHMHRRAVNPDKVVVRMIPGRFGLPERLNGPPVLRPAPEHGGEILFEPLGVEVPDEFASVLTVRATGDAVEIYPVARVEESKHAVTLRLRAVYNQRNNAFASRDSFFPAPPSELEVRIRFGIAARFNGQDILNRGDIVSPGEHYGVSLRYGGVDRGLHYLYGVQADSHDTPGTTKNEKAATICSPAQNEMGWRLPTAGELEGLMHKGESSRALRSLRGDSAAVPGVPAEGLRLSGRVPLPFAPRGDFPPNTLPSGITRAYADLYAKGWDTPMMMAPNSEMIFSRDGGATPVCVAPVNPDAPAPVGIAGARVRNHWDGSLLAESLNRESTDAVAYFPEYGEGALTLEFAAYRERETSPPPDYPRAPILNVRRIGRMDARTRMTRVSPPGSPVALMALSVKAGAEKQMLRLEAELPDNFAPRFELELRKSTLSFARQNIAAPGDLAVVPNVARAREGGGSRDLQFKYLGRARGLHWMESVRNYPADFVENGCASAAAASFPWRTPQLGELAAALGLARLGSAPADLPGWDEGAEIAAERGGPAANLEFANRAARTNLFYENGRRVAVRLTETTADVVTSSAGLVCVTPAEPESYRRPVDLAATRFVASGFLARAAITLNPGLRGEFLLTAEAQMWRYNGNGLARIVRDGNPTIRIVGPNPTEHVFTHSPKSGAPVSVTVQMLYDSNTDGRGRQRLTLKWNGRGLDGVETTIRIQGGAPFGGPGTLAIVLKDLPRTPHVDIFEETRPKRTVVKGYVGAVYVARPGGEAALNGIANELPPPLYARGVAVMQEGDVGRVGARMFAVITVEAQRPGHLPILAAHTLEISVWKPRFEIPAYSAASGEPGAFVGDLADEFREVPGGVFRKLDWADGARFQVGRDGKIFSPNELPTGGLYTLAVEYEGGEHLLGAATLTVQVDARRPLAVFDRRAFFNLRGRIAATLLAGERPLDLIYHGERNGVAVVYGLGRLPANGGENLCAAGAREGWRAPSLGELLGLFYNAPARAVRVLLEENQTASIAGLARAENIALPYPPTGEPPLKINTDPVYPDFHIRTDEGLRAPAALATRSASEHVQLRAFSELRGRPICVRGAESGHPVGLAASFRGATVITGDYYHDHDAARSFLAPPPSVTVYFGSDDETFEMTLAGWRRVPQNGRAQTVIVDESFSVSLPKTMRRFSGWTSANGKRLNIRPLGSVSRPDTTELITVEFKPPAGSASKVVMELHVPIERFLGAPIFEGGREPFPAEFKTTSDKGVKLTATVSMINLGRRRGVRYIISERDDILNEERIPDNSHAYSPADFCEAEEGWRLPSVGELAGLMTDAAEVTVAAYHDRENSAFNGVFDNLHPHLLPEGATVSTPPDGISAPEFEATPNLTAYPDYYALEKSAQGVEPSLPLASLSEDGGGLEFRLSFNSPFLSNQRLGGRVVCAKPDGSSPASRAPSAPSFTWEREEKGGAFIADFLGVDLHAVTLAGQTLTLSADESEVGPEAGFFSATVQAARYSPRFSPGFIEPRPEHPISVRLLNGGNDFGMSVRPDENQPGRLEIELYVSNPSFSGGTVLTVEATPEFGIGGRLLIPVYRPSGKTGMIHLRPIFSPTPSGEGREAWAESSLRMFSAKAPSAGMTFAAGMSTCSSICSAVATGFHSPLTSLCSVWKRCRRFSSPSTAWVWTRKRSPLNASARWRMWVSAV